MNVAPGHWLRRLTASLIFLGGAVALLYVLSGVFVPTADSKEMWAGYRSLSPDSIDVLFVGNSHAYTSIAPMQLWRDHRITSWDIGASAINMRMKRAYIEEALRTQNPKVLALELYSTQKPTVVGDRENHWAYDHMPLGLSKLLSMSDTAVPTQWESVLLPVEQYHQNYTTLPRKNISSFLGLHPHASTGGATPLSKPAAPDEDPAAGGGEPIADAKEGASASATSAAAAAEADSAAEIARIAEICASRGIRLVLWISPVKTTYAGGDELLARLKSELQPRYPDVLYVNTNDHKQEIGLVSSDFREWGHLYAWGMKKHTEWFATSVLAQAGVYGPSATPDAAWWDAQAAQWDPPTGLAP